MIITAIIITILITLRIRRNKNLQRLTWILGEWECIENDEKLTELWTRDKKANYECVRKSSKNRLIAESYYLMEKSGNLILVPMIYNEDQIQPFSFKQETLSDEKAEFINNELAFPRRICYTMLNDKEMQMDMSGVLLERDYVESYIFTRKSDRQFIEQETNIFRNICRKVRKILSKN